ncbi:MAG: ribonuclease Z [Acidobacteria bacterium]|nr:ribonuclease Z [Acidobacteriota bacterium]
MRLVVLGSGTSVPHPRRASASHWLEARGGTLLLDCGAAAVHRMAQEGCDWASLDAVWISHFHLDHVGGLPAFLFGTRHAPQTRGRRKPLTIYGAGGLEKLLRAFDAANDYKLFEQPFPLRVQEISPLESFEPLAGLRARTLPTPHKPESLALRLDEAETGASFVYTSDTGYADALVEFSRGTSLLLAECSFPFDKPVETHLELADAMRLARLASPRRVVLSHLYPEWDDHELEAEAKKLWDGETLEARDGLRLEI